MTTKAIELAERVDRAIDELEAAVEALHAECAIYCQAALAPRRARPHPLYERSLDFVHGALQGRRLLGIALGGHGPHLSVAEPFRLWPKED